MENAIKLLHLEDNPADSQLVQAMLKRADVPHKYFFADNEIDFRRILETMEIDIILSDYHLPDFSGTEALFLAKTEYPDIPFVFVSGTMGEDVAIESLLNGATDYVLKNKMERLVPAIYRAHKEARVHKEKRRTENELRKLSRAVDQSPNSIVITATDGTMEYVNPTTIELTGYTSEELIGNNPRVFSMGEKTKEEYAHFWDTISSGGVWKGEFHNKKKNGELYWESATIAPIFNDSGEIMNYLAIKTDITESKKLENDLLAAKEKAEESDRLKTAFLLNISHEIRTPMNGILGFSELLKTPGLSGDEQLEYIRFIKISSDRMLNIITDIVDISKIEAGQAKVTLSEININEQIKNIYTLFLPESKNKGIELCVRKSLSDEESVTMTDRPKLFSILTHLLKNALKYTEKGTIEFGYEIENVTEPGHALAQHLQFFVKDTGIGIPKHRHQAIFHRFVQADIADTRAYQGAGLGLSISKAYVDMLGGTIWVKSMENEGSTFYFTIPYNSLARKNNPVKNDISAQKIAGLKKKLKVLIVEDDATSVMLLMMLAKEFCRETLIADTGIEAIELCKSHTDIDLILMDIKMSGMGGYETTREIRQFNKEVVIIAQTAFGLSGDREKSIDAGCNDYISKPVEADLLFGLIQKYFYKF